jgi:hypothetical protein
MENNQISYTLENWETWGIANNRYGLENRFVMKQISNIGVIYQYANESIYAVGFQYETMPNGATRGFFDTHRDKHITPSCYCGYRHDIIAQNEKKWKHGKIENYEGFIRQKGISTIPLLQDQFREGCVV